MKINPSHPRAASLAIREKLVNGVKLGITSTAGLIAHGRGEAFDYLIGEKTHQFAHDAINAAAALLLLSKKPVLSINGNTAALVPDTLAAIAHLLDCSLEVNLFHFSQKRLEKIEEFLATRARTHLIRRSASELTALPGIASDRKIVTTSGIASADTVFVPLEDGDRCEALVASGKQVITVDLNPLSRTAWSATITIVDNIVRTLPLLHDTVQIYKESKSVSKLKDIVRHYHQPSTLSSAYACMEKHLHRLSRRD